MAIRRYGTKNRRGEVLDATEPRQVIVRIPPYTGRTVANFSMSSIYVPKETFAYDTLNKALNKALTPRNSYCRHMSSLR